MQFQFNKYKKENWILKDNITQDQLRNYYSHGSALISSSTYEELPLIMLQTMACKLLVICIPNTVEKDIIKHKKEVFIILVIGFDLLKNKITFLYENYNI